MGHIHCFIHSPLAYICMRELIAVGGYERTHLYIIATSRAGAEMLESMATADEWTSREIAFRGWERGIVRKIRSSFALLRCAFRLRILVRGIGVKERVAICHLANPYSRLICSIRRRIAPGEPVVVVDDGTTTLVEHAIMVEQGRISVENSSPRARNWFSLLESVLFSSAPIDAEQTEFFSIWPLPAAPAGQGPKLAQRNELAGLRSRLTSRTRRAAVYFIGQPFVRRGLIQAGEYAEILCRIKDYYATKGLDFRYFPHRNEDPASYPAELEVVRLDVPFEIFLLGESQWPQVVAGFYSACIVTSQYLFRGGLRYEVFWGFPSLGPEVATSRAVADAFRVQCVGGMLDINTSLRLGSERTASIGSS